MDVEKTFSFAFLVFDYYSVEYSFIDENGTQHKGKTSVKYNMAETKALENRGIIKI